MPKAPGQTRVRIVGCDVSIPETIIISKGSQPWLPFFMEKILQAAAELGALHALIQTGHLKPYLKKSEAFRRYSRKKVERWIAEGFITPRKDGDHSAAWRIDHMEIATLAKTIELLSYL